MLLVFTIYHLGLKLQTFYGCKLQLKKHSGRIFNNSRASEVCHTLSQFVTLSYHFVTLYYYLVQSGKLCDTLPLCHTLPYFATLCHTLLHFATLCYYLLNFVTLSYTLTHFVTDCHTLLYFVTLRHNLARHVLPKDSGIDGGMSTNQSKYSYSISAKYL